MALRLDITNKQDREFLEKRGLLNEAMGQVFGKRDKTSGPRSKKPTQRNLNAKERKPSKFKNHIIEAEGVKWASKYEYACWQVLKDLQAQGKISNLKRQVTLSFVHNDVKIWVTRPDFYFEVPVDMEKKVPVYADAKNSFTNRTRTFQTSQKMMKAFYGREMLVFLQDKHTDIEAAIKNLQVELM